MSILLGLTYNDFLFVEFEVDYLLKERKSGKYSLVWCRVMSYLLFKATYDERRDGLLLVFGRNRFLEWGI
jgi:hypothetical protein